MFTQSDISTLRQQGTTDRQIMEMTAKVIPSAYKALQAMDSDTATPEVRKNEILKQMVDRNAGNGISMIPYVGSLMSNSAMKMHDNLEMTNQKKDEQFSLFNTAKLTAKRAVGALASVPEALMYPVVQGARAADYLAGKAAEPFTGKKYGDLVAPDQLEQIRQQSWQAAPTASAVLMGAAALSAGLSIPAISTRASITSGGLAGIGTLETGGSIKNAAMNALITGVSTKGLMSFNPLAASSTAVGADVAGRYMSGQELDSPSAAESYISSAALGYVAGRANKVGTNSTKVYQKANNPQATSAPIGARLQTVAQRIYQSALKPTKSILDKFPDVVKTGLEEKIPVTKSGHERVLSHIDTINEQIGREIQSGVQKGQVVFSDNVVKALADTVAFYQDTIGGKQSVKELQALAKQFVKDEGVSIPIDRAQRLKVNTYQVLRKAYGEMKSLEVEGKKAIARGLKDEIVSAIPELKTLNARESSLIGLDQALERFTGRHGNRDLIDLTSGIGGAVGASIDGGGGLLKGFAITKLAKMAFDHPSINSRLAILLNDLGKRLSPVLTPEEVPAGMEIINLQGASQGKQPIPQQVSKPSPTTLPQSTVESQVPSAGGKVTAAEKASLTPEERATGLIGGGGDNMPRTVKLDSVNPTGSVFVEYTPEKRATMPLGDNMTTLDKTSGKSPDSIVSIYRGTSSPQKEIVAGDFITTNKQLAKDYAGNGKVLEKKVPMKDILDDITEPLGEEYIYWPKINSSPDSSLLSEARKYKSAQKELDSLAKRQKELFAIPRDKITPAQKLELKQIFDKAEELRKSLPVSPEDLPF